MLKQLAAAIVLSTVTSTVFAEHYARYEAKQIYDLKDGATLYVFQDGKMALQSKYGYAMPLQKGGVLEARDGQKVTAGADAVLRLADLLEREHVRSD